MSSPSIETIQERVCAHFHIPRIEMRSDRRQRKYARPRQVAMYLAKELTPGSYPMIGRLFGGRDHTTVMYAIRIVEQRRGRDPEFDGHVRALLLELAPSAEVDADQPDLFVEAAA